MQHPWHYELAGLTLAGWLHRPPNATPDTPLIVATHGWLDNANSFLPLAKRLTNYQLLAFDWPGHGLSDHIAEHSNYHFVDWADTLLQVLDAQIGPVILLGHSMGALVNTLVAAAFPEKVSKLILIEGAGPLTVEPEQATAMLRKGLLSRTRTRNKLARHFDTLEDVVKTRQQASPDLNDALVTLLVERNVEASNQQLRWRYDPRLKALSAMRMTELQAQQLLSNIECDVLTVIADQGYAQVRQLLEQRRSCFKSIQKVVLPGGHHVHMTRPDDLAELIDEFVAN
ncbi:alpha/beta hydrolase [Neiella marina]|uniref:Alpha/beta hydrolase n=1 Tax=Neiella holothuriorum TaxID=2870530 RepID=A0ABS7ECW1_9GAMM|nr:alpha/beta hydrolase [Neiella holothuriorum]MBW8190172.1 alpha/beta hydrolase [Neiella holothuriorum]